MELLNIQSFHLFMIVYWFSIILFLPFRPSVGFRLWIDIPVSKLKNLMVAMINITPDSMTDDSDSDSDDDSDLSDAEFLRKYQDHINKRYSLHIISNCISLPIINTSHFLTIMDDKYPLFLSVNIFTSSKKLTLRERKEQDYRRLYKNFNLVQKLINKHNSVFST